MYSYPYQDAFILRFFLFAVTYTIKYIIHPYTGMLKVFCIDNNFIAVIYPAHMYKDPKELYTGILPNGLSGI